MYGLSDTVQRCLAGAQAMAEMIDAQEAGITRQYPWILPSQHRKEKSSPYMVPFNDIPVAEGLNVDMSNINPRPTQASEQERSEMEEQLAIATEDERRDLVLSLAGAVLTMLDAHASCHAEGLLDLADGVKLEKSRYTKFPPASWMFGFFELKVILLDPRFSPGLEPAEARQMMRDALAPINELPKEVRLSRLSSLVRSRLRSLPEENQIEGSEIVLWTLCPMMDALFEVASSKRIDREDSPDPLSKGDRAQAVQDGYETIKGFIRATFEGISWYQKEHHDYSFGWDTLQSLVAGTDHQNGFDGPSEDPASLSFQLNRATLSNRAGIVMTAVMEQLEQKCGLLKTMGTFKGLVREMHELDLLHQTGCAWYIDGNGEPQVQWD